METRDQGLSPLTLYHLRPHFTAPQLAKTRFLDSVHSCYPNSLICGQNGYLSAHPQSKSHRTHFPHEPLLTFGISDTVARLHDGVR